MSVAPGEIYETDPGIARMNPGVTQIMYRAQYRLLTGCASYCMPNPRRRYLHVLENGHESNVAAGYRCGIDGIFECCFIPSNVCCLEQDYLRKQYFDRGMFDQRSCWWQMGWYNGAPSTHARQIKQVCFCQDCCECWNAYSDGCYCESWFGERVRLLVYEKYCCCCPTRACWLHNCCGLCGPKSGEPLACFLVPFETCLSPGGADALVAAMDSSREAWRQRTGKA